MFESDFLRWFTERVLADICFVEALVMNGDDDVIEAVRPWMGPTTWEDVQHMYWRRDGKLPPTG